VSESIVGAHQRLIKALSGMQSTMSCLDDSSAPGVSKVEEAVQLNDSHGSGTRINMPLRTRKGGGYVLDEWLARKDEIRVLYVDQGKSCEETKKEMERKGFYAT
jgi:hypothetical protein